MTKYAYCKICDTDKEVASLVRMPMETFQKVVWVILSLATVGIAAIVFALVYANRKKIHCPTCQSKVQITSEPHAKSEKEGEPLTQRERILKKADQAKEKKVKSKAVASSEVSEENEKEQKFCPYCGEDIDAGISKCPYCHSTLKTPY
jgi:hypothetical protein